MLSAVTVITYMLKDVAAVAALLMMMHYIFLHEWRFGKIKTTVLALLTAANALFGVLYLAKITEDYKAVMDIVSNILCIASVYLFTDSKIHKKNWLTVFISLCTADMFYSLISGYIGDVLYIECMVNTAFFALVCIFIRCTAQRAEINFLPKIFEKIPAWIYVVLLLFELTCYYKEFGLSSAWYKVLHNLSSSAVIFCILFLVFKVFYMAHCQNEILKQMAEQKNFGEKAAIGDEALRRFRHDYKNHMLVINAYLENGKTEEARRYLDSINHSIKGVINKIRTGNFVADAIMNNKADSCEENGIQLIFSGVVPSEGIQSEDLCTVLSNLLDNAAEACEKLGGNKQIDVEASVFGGFFVLTVSNPTNSVKNLKTTKKDKRNHGIGLKNVNRTAEKYDGNVKVDIDNGIFTATVKMKLMKETVLS